MPAPRGSLIIADGDLPALLACAAATPERAAVAWIPGAGERSEAARGHAELYGHEVTVQDGSEDIDDQWRHSLLLLLACRAAAKRGITEVIWPVHAGPELDLEAVAGIVDRALLVTRLAAMNPAGGIEVRAPYADFTDDQIADLAVDMDLPVRTCWWWEPRTETARSVRSRWGAALARAGWSDLGSERPPASRGGINTTATPAGA